MPSIQMGRPLAECAISKEKPTMTSAIRRLPILMSAGLLMGSLAFAEIICPPDGGGGGSQTETLFAGQTHYAGTVSIAVVDSSLCVTYQTDGPWLLTETHLAIADSLAGIPQTRSGNPRPGQFPWSATHNPPVPQFTYCVNYPYVIGQPLFVATHAVVRTSGGGAGGSETAWAGDLDFPGANWATYFTFVPDDGCIEID